MLADADEFGVARAPAKEMIMRRAARERGVKVKYHGGVSLQEGFQNFCTDVPVRVGTLYRL